MENLISADLSQFVINETTGVEIVVSLPALKETSLDPNRPRVPYTTI